MQWPQYNSPIAALRAANMHQLPSTMAVIAISAFLVIIVILAIKATNTVANHFRGL